MEINRNKWKSELNKGIKRSQWESIGVNVNQYDTMIINGESIGISRRYWEFIGINGNQN